MEDFEISHCHHKDLHILAITTVSVTGWIRSEKYFSKAHWLSLPYAVKWLVFFSVKEWICIQKIIFFSLMIQNTLKLLTSKTKGTWTTSCRVQKYRVHSCCDTVQSLHPNLSLEVKSVVLTVCWSYTDFFFRFTF